MKQLDRYLFSRLMALFGFFALVLVSVYWVNRAVSLFDKLIGDGQTAWVVLEFTLLTLPNVIRLVLPVAAFAATIYAVNRLSADSELVVMQATGASPWRLARPVAVFGLLIAALMAVLVHVLVPVSRAKLAERQAEVSENITARVLVEGSFQHPAPGITIYIRAISDRGELLDFFLSDAREPQEQTTYVAERAVLVPSASGPKLVMFDGTAQTLRNPGENLALTRFTDLTYDIGALMGARAEGHIDWDELPSQDLLFPSDEILTATGGTKPEAFRILNERVAQPLIAPVAVLLGFAALMLGSFSRFGMWRQITLAVIGLIVLQMLANTVDSAMQRNNALWPLAYLPALIGTSVAGLVLWWAARPRRVRQHPVRRSAA
ncbi:LPS export ABC transporter permease LptF [Sinirhodobacter populi]|uniref:LPS export ABC transporter permease LptF n=1 Tax=Paenirhodobacter populi TaxID=2306993 RepID=A0A443KAW5_9RHOB|nr:LPS export ABC transporter permease LptF [Sinirhodobacter populi]RWR29783.1 LPS export ABC transporter permease LptF [Sinirhodobacter populi]